MNRKMQLLMAEIEGRMALLRNNREPDELHMRKCMGKTILLMKNLRETFVESGKYCELVRSDASKSLQKCRQHMGFLFTRVPCNEGGGRVNQELQRAFHQHMDAVLMELGQFIKETPRKQNSDHRDEVRMGLQHINHELMILDEQAEREAAVRRLDTERNRARKLRSELSKSQLTIQLDLDASHNDGGDAIEQCSPKWSDLIAKLSGQMKKTHQIPRQIPDCNKWRQLSESCENLTRKRTHLDLRESKDNESQTSWRTDPQDSGTPTQTRSTSSDSLFRSEATISIPVSVSMKNTHQSLRQIPDCKARPDWRHHSESCLKENKDTTAVAGPIQTKEYQDFLAQIYKPIAHRSSTSLDPLFLRTPVAIQASLTKTSSLPVTLKPRRSQSNTSHYSLGKTFGDKRLRLLRWCKERTRPYGLPMYEFSESWTSGRALIALMHSYHESLIELRFLSKESPRDTLTYAAAVAKSLGVSCGVDIVQECLQKKPDFCRVFSFVLELRRCLDLHKKINKFF